MQQCPGLASEPGRTPGPPARPAAAAAATDPCAGGERCMHAGTLAVVCQTPASINLQSASTAALGQTKSAANPVFELTFNPEEIKFRLAAVPVFAVVNAKSEFVLVSSDDDLLARQLGLFFFSRDEAEALVATVRHNIFVEEPCGCKWVGVSG